LNEKSNEELLSLLKKLDPQTAATVDFKNKRRLIRALEVCIFSGAPFFEQRLKGPALFDFLQIGIDMPREVLYDRINTRIDQMMAAGLLAEVKSLVKHQYSWDLPSQSGIGYRQFRDYFEGKISLDEAVENLKRDSRHYAKRQLTWFKRDKRVQWVESYEEAERMVGEFLKY